MPQAVKEEIEVSSGQPKAINQTKIVGWAMSFPLKHDINILACLTDRSARISHLE